MARMCVNKSHPFYKLMVDRYGGETEANRKWIDNGFAFDEDLTLPSEDIRDTFFNTGSDSATRVFEDPKYKKFINKEMTKFLEKIGVQVNAHNGVFYSESLGREVDAEGMFDAWRWSVDYKRDASNEVMPEEAAHAMMWMLKNKNNFKYKELVKYGKENFKDIYTKIEKEYGERYENKSEDLDFEFAGHLLRDAVMDKLKEKYDKNLIEKLLDFIQEIVHFFTSLWNLDEAGALKKLADMVVNYENYSFDKIIGDTINDYDRVKKELDERIVGTKVSSKDRNLLRIGLSARKVTRKRVFYHPIAENRDDIIKLAKELNTDSSTILLYFNRLPQEVLAEFTLSGRKIPTVGNLSTRVEAIIFEYVEKGAVTPEEGVLQGHEYNKQILENIKQSHTLLMQYADKYLPNKPFNNYEEWRIGFMEWFSLITLLSNKANGIPFDAHSLMKKYNDMITDYFDYLGKNDLYKSIDEDSWQELLRLGMQDGKKPTNDTSKYSYIDEYGVRARKALKQLQKSPTYTMESRGYNTESILASMKENSMTTEEAEYLVEDLLYSAIEELESEDISWFIHPMAESNMISPKFFKGNGKDVEALMSDVELIVDFNMRSTIGLIEGLLPVTKKEMLARRITGVSFNGNDNFDDLHPEEAQAFMDSMGNTYKGIFYRDIDEGVTAKRMKAYHKQIQKTEHNANRLWDIIKKDKKMIEEVKKLGQGDKEENIKYLEKLQNKLSSYILINGKLRLSDTELRDILVSKDKWGKRDLNAYTSPMIHDESGIYYNIKSPENTTLEQIDGRLDDMNDTFVKGPDGQYINKKDNNKTATDKTASQLKKSKNKIEDDAVLNKMSEYGTKAGAIYQDLLKSLYEGKEPKNTELEDRLFEVLLASAEETFSQIKEQQRIINLKAGTPDAKFTMRFEQVLVDTKARLGGSMDVMILFSDKTAGVLDIKTMFSRSFINAETGLIDYFIYKEDKKEQHKAQLNAYVRMLKQIIGVKDVTMIRIIPIIARYDDETQTAHLTTETKDNEILSNIVIGDEKTGIPSLDNYISIRMKVLESLKNRRKDINRGMRNTNDSNTKIEYQIELGNLNTRIKAIDSSIQDAFIRKDLASAIGSAYTLKNEINIELDKDLDKIDQGKVKDLIEELESIIVLEEVNFDLRTYGEDKTEEQIAKHKRFSHDLNSLRELLHELKSVRDLKAIEFWKLDSLMQVNYVDRLIGASKNTKMDNWFMRWLGNITDQSNPYVQLVYKKVAEFAASRDFERNKFVTELRKYATPEISKAIVNRATGTLITKLDYDASYGKLKEMPEKTEEEKLAKAKAIMSIYKYEDYNQAEVSKQIIEVLDGEFRNADKTFKTDLKGKSREKEYNKQKENRLLNNLLYSITDPTILNVRGVLHLFKYRFLTLKDENKYLTTEYKSLSKEHREALEWYYKWNREFKAMLDIREHKELPANFIPLIRKEMIDRWRDSPSIMDFVASQANFWKEDFTELESDSSFGKRDELPIKFLRTSSNLQNVKDDQSYDLFDTFNAFSEFAFHYKYFSDVLPQISALKEVLIDKAIVNDKELTTESDLIKYLENILQYSVFKVKMYKNEALEGLTNRFSVNKGINKLSNFQTTTTLGANTMSSSASHIAGKFSAAIEGKKGNLYTIQQHTKALKDMITNRTHYLAFCGFINVYPEADAHRLGLKPDEHHWISDNHPDKLKSYIGSRNSLLFKTWQWGEEDVTNSVTVSMGQNYGIDKNGVVRHMQFLPKDSISLYDGMTYDKETGEVKFKDNEGNAVKDNEKVYIQFRNIARAGIRNIVGTANDQDIAMYRMELVGRLAMKYKSWMPGVFLERTKQLKVNEYAQVMEIGRYRALTSHYYDEDSIRENKMELLYATANLAKDLLANFAMLGGIVGQNFYKLDRQKCREQFNKWKEKMREDNPYELEKLEQLTTDEEKQLDLFIKAKQGQLTALLIELRVLLGLVGMTLALSLAAAGADDDDWVKGMAVKKLIRLTDKVRSEIGFFFAVGDLLSMVEKPLPILSSVGLMLKLLYEVGDESRDAIFGENQVTKTGKSIDKSDIITYLKQLVPGWKIGDLLEMFIPDDEDDK